MTPFEDELRRALARREPSGDFSARVLAQVREQEPHRERPAWSWFGWTWFGWARAWVVVAAIALMLIPAGVLYRRHERAVRGETAKQQLILALRIAGSKLDQASQRVRAVEFMETQ